MGYLTKLPGVPDRDEVKPGMAHFAGTGPAGKTCGDCKWRGYFRKGRDKFNPHTNLIESKQVKTMGCREFLRLSHSHGPAVYKGWPACKFFVEAAK
ncbi:hypothetical protein [Bradyrhizobium sp. USDA 4508]